jgi:hypothetical protein
MDDLLADRAEQQARKAATPAVADHDQARVCSLVDQYLGGLTLESLPFALEARRLPSHEGDRLLDELLRVAPWTVELVWGGWELTAAGDDGAPEGRAGDFVRLSGRRGEG